MTISDALHRLLLDNLTTATLLLNDALRLEYMNPAAEMLLAISGQRSHGQFISELFTETTEALQSLRLAVEQAHPFTKREALLTSATGQTLTVDYAVTPILSTAGTMLLLEVHPRDRLLRITKEEAQLSKQETSKMLVRGLAHEIKNPLGGIRGAAQLLARQLPDENLRDYTNVILKTASEDRLRLALRSLFIEQQCVIDREVRGVQQKSQNQVLGLTDTEYEVLQDIALGLTDRIIAQRRNLSLRSVQNRLQQLYEKLGVRQPCEATDSVPAFNLRARAVNVALLRKLLNRTALEQAEIELQEWLKDPRFNYLKH